MTGNYFGHAPKTPEILPAKNKMSPADRVRQHQFRRMQGQRSCCMIETSSVPPRKSSATFGNLRQSSAIFGKCSKNVRRRSSWLRNNFVKSLEIFGKWSELFGKSSKTSLSLVRYRVEYSKIKFISTHRHAIFPIYFFSSIWAGRNPKSSNLIG